MEPSDEIRDAMLRLYEILREDDHLGFEDLWSARDGTVAMMTDYEEWLRGHGPITALFRLQSEVFQEHASPAPTDDDPGARWQPSPDLVAYQEGSVGWAVDRPSHPLPIRVTAIFHLERSVWKLVHAHLSLGVPNESAWGWHFPLHVDVEQVEAPAGDARLASSSPGTTTILFTDIEDSTKRAAEVGDRRWMQLLREHNGIVRKQVAIHGGREVKSQGDGFMLAFSSAIDAVRAAIGMQRALGSLDSALRVRMGIHTGEVIREANDLYGTAVNLAARIMSTAAGGEILVSSLVHDLVVNADAFRFADVREIELKGFSGTQRVRAVYL